MKGLWLADAPEVAVGNVLGAWCAQPTGGANPAGPEMPLKVCIARRAETGSAFNRRFFDNRRLWLALTAAVLALQMLVVHWPPAQAIFDTASLSAADWALAAVVASSVLLLEEARKRVARAISRSATFGAPA